jgi:histidinol-phosphate aminotransferase
MRFSVRGHLLEIPPYVPGKPIEELRRELGPPYVTKLASNENPLGPSPKAIEAIRRGAADVHRYPDANGFELREALAAKTGVPFDQIVLGNGSDELIGYLSVLLLEPGSEVVIGDPGFVRYEASGRVQESRVIKVPLAADERHDVDAMADACTPLTRIVWIANPHNPTGTIAYRSEIERLVSRLPSHALLVLDEAYYEYVEDDRYSPAHELVLAGLPVVGLRTFSKAYGMAGMRIGYGMVPAEIADALAHVRCPFNVNTLAQKGALAALEDHEHLTASISSTRSALRRVTALLASIGCKVTASHANFVWADLGRPANPLCDALLREGVIIRSGDIFGRPNCVRVSAGTDEQLDHFERALAAATEGMLTA